MWDYFLSNNVWGPLFIVTTSVSQLAAHANTLSSPRFDELPLSASSLFTHEPAAVTRLVYFKLHVVLWVYYNANKTVQEPAGLVFISKVLTLNRFILRFRSRERTNECATSTSRDGTALTCRIIYSIYNWLYRLILTIPNNQMNVLASVIKPQQIYWK